MIRRSGLTPFAATATSTGTLPQLAPPAHAQAIATSRASGMSVLTGRGLCLLLCLLPACGGSGDAENPDARSIDAGNSGTGNLDGPKADGTSSDATVADGGLIDAARPSDAASTDAALAGTGNTEAGACSQLPVALGAAGNFVVLAGSAVTN